MAGNEGLRLKDGGVWYWTERCFTAEQKKQESGKKTRERTERGKERERGGKRRKCEKDEWWRWKKWEMG